MDPAKVVLHSALLESNEPAVVYYYLGEVCHAAHQPDLALYYYKKSQSEDGGYLLNRIGEGKVLLKDRPQEAEAIFTEVLSGKNKKDPHLLRAVVDAYAENASPKTEEYLQKVKNIDGSNVGIFVLEGDMLAAQQKAGDACSCYEQAIYFYPSCVEAYVKYARIYAASNERSAVDMLQRLLRVKPDCAVAWRELAEVYYAHSRYKDAAEAYEKCIHSTCCGTRDKVRYATVLFQYGDFMRSLALARQIAAENPGNKVVKRVMMYDLYALNEYDEGLIQAGEFFKAMKPEDVIGQDYLYYGRLLQAKKEYAKAIPQLRKALDADQERTGIYKEVAENWERLDQYDSAIVHYSDFIKHGGKKVSLVDYFQLGRCHFYASSDSTKGGVANRTAHLMTADSLFGYMAKERPDSYLGNFWRARVNSSLDPETEKGLAQPYYGAAAVLLEKGDKTPRNSRMLVECYSFLGYYYYLKNDLSVSKEYWNKILVIEPENDVAKKAIEGMK